MLPNTCSVIPQARSLTALSRINSNLLLCGIAAACIAAVVIALISQHVYGMQPCAWCVLQRMAFLAVALSCGLALLIRNLAAQFFIHAVAIGYSVSGIASSLWQHFNAASSISCTPSLADRTLAKLGFDVWAPGLFAPRASCADSAVNLLGIPYEFWSLTAFVLVTGALLLSAGLGISEHRHRHRTALTPTQ